MGFCLKTLVCQSVAHCERSLNMLASIICICVHLNDMACVVTIFLLKLELCKAALGILVFSLSFPYNLQFSVPSIWKIAYNISIQSAAYDKEVALIPVLMLISQSFPCVNHKSCPRWKASQHVFSNIDTHDDFFPFCCYRVFGLLMMIFSVLLL